MMDRAKKTLRICEEGHRCYKSSDCPICPQCDAQRKPKEGFLSLLAAPARRALITQGVISLVKLSKLSEEDVLRFHGMGPGSIPKLEKALKEAGLTFKKITGP